MSPYVYKFYSNSKYKKKMSQNWKFVPIWFFAIWRHKYSGYWKGRSEYWINAGNPKQLGLTIVWTDHPYLLLLLTTACCMSAVYYICWQRSFDCCQRSLVSVVNGLLRPLLKVCYVRCEQSVASVVNGLLHPLSTVCCVRC